jgi:hypothetical protein
LCDLDSIPSYNALGVKNQRRAGERLAIFRNPPRS